MIDISNVEAIQEHCSQCTIPSPSRRTNQMDLVPLCFLGEFFEEYAIAGGHDSLIVLEGDDVWKFYPQIPIAIINEYAQEMSILEEHFSGNEQTVMVEEEEYILKFVEISNVFKLGDWCTLASSPFVFGDNCAIDDQNRWRRGEDSVLFDLIVTEKVQAYYDELAEERGIEWNHNVHISAVNIKVDRNNSIIWVTDCASSIKHFVEMVSVLR
jgi:hypothetical protein